MYIEAVPNRGSPPAILLRESYREAGKVKKRTLLNLCDWPHERIAGFKALLDHVVLVGDRGMITQARITEDIKAAGLDWITALRAPANQGVARRRRAADVAV